MPDWIAEHQQYFVIFGIASLVMFVASLLVMPILIVRIPADYYAHERRPPSRFAATSPATRWLLLIGKNLLGVVLILGGLIMLVLPGQGLLTIFAGFVLIDFPRKYTFERWLVGRRWISRPINWLRCKRGHEPLQVQSTN